MPAPRGVVVALVSILVALANLAASAPPGAAAAVVAWPPSVGALIAEVVTGGASASDEYVEIANASGAPIDLGGCELVYVTASGATITRKAAFSSPAPLGSGQHMLIANAAGAFGPLADMTYSGGLAADGGSLALRRADGAVIDSIGWGSATNAYVEGVAAPAPPARSSLERRPGGEGGNVLDTNDNAADWYVQANPIPQALSSVPVPAPSAGATSTPATGTPVTSDGPTASATSSQATGSPESTRSDSESTPSPSVSSIAVARVLPDDSRVVVEGVLTTRLAALDGGRGGFLQDETAGIGLYLPEVPAAPLPAGTVVRVSGAVYDRYGQRTIRVDAGGLAILGQAPLPEPVTRATGAAGEADEGMLIAVAGTLISSPDALADGLGLWLDDGSGALRGVATPSALDAISLAKGMRLAVIGPLGQRESGGSTGYRIEATEPGSVVVLADGMPSSAPSSETTPSSAPSSETTPSSEITPSPESTSSPSSAPSQPVPTPTEPDVDLEPVALARTQSAGTRVHLAGVVTAAPGLTGVDELLAIEDSSAGIFLRASGPMSNLEVGRSVEVVGRLAAPYGQLEVREIEWLVVGSQDGQPASASVGLGEIGERREGSLVTVTGRVDSVQTSDGRLSLAVADGTHVLRVLADSRTGLSRADVSRGAAVLLTGVVGQRATASGREDGYRLWLRGRADLAPDPLASTPTPTPTPSAGPSAETGASTASPVASGKSVFHDLAGALAARGSLVELDATVTAPAGLFAWGGPTIVVDDGTAAVAVLLPDEAQVGGSAATPTGTAAAAIRIGTRVHIAGKVGVYRSGPRVVATLVQPLGETEATEPRQIESELGAELEWRLVQVGGRIDRVTRVGVRWRIDLLAAGRSVAILGEPTAGIAVSSDLKGRFAVVIGIVRRSTSDHTKFVLLPRSRLDLRLGPSLGHAPAALSSGRPAASFDTSLPRVEVAGLANLLGQTVVVSGLVVDVAGGTATLDDGTGQARLGGRDAEDAISLLEPEDAVEVTGTVERDAAGLLLRVDPDRMVVVSNGDLGSDGSGTGTGSVSGSGAATGSAVAGGLTGGQPDLGAAGPGRNLIPGWTGLSDVGPAGLTALIFALVFACVALATLLAIRQIRRHAGADRGREEGRQGPNRAV